MPSYHAILSLLFTWRVVSSSIPHATPFLKKNEYPSASSKGGNNHPRGSDNNEERYSRQVYALGGRAHKLVRSSGVVLDGPFGSGLMYECAKNLALSGIERIILLRDTNVEGKNDPINMNLSASRRMKLLHEMYHDKKYDDLGNAYRRTAENEVAQEKVGVNHSPSRQWSGKDEVMEFLFIEYLKRLNPYLSVDVIDRTMFESNVFAKKSGYQKQMTMLCIDRPQSTQMTMNNLCRERDIPFVSVESRGVFGKVFCDFGKEFHVFDEDGEVPKQTLVENIVSLNKGESQSFTINCVNGESHDVSRGDIIKLDYGERQFFEQGKTSQYNLQMEVDDVKSPNCIVCIPLAQNNDEASMEAINTILEKKTEFMSFSKVKVPRKVSFLPMETVLQEMAQMKGRSDYFTAADLDKSFNLQRRAALMGSFSAVEVFLEKFNRLPKAKTIENGTTNKKYRDEESFYEIVEDVLKTSYTTENGDLGQKAIIQMFANCCAATLAPVQALMGSLAAQEVLKAISGLYNPIQQFLLYDCEELINACNDNSNTYKEWDDVAPGQSYVLSRKETHALAKKRIFVVGAGAIGCEILKNLSAMGAGTMGEGCIVVTDMDRIERSNLSRQLLFREDDVGKFKAVAAKSAILKFNQNVSITSHSNKVGDENDIVFNDSFWSNEIDVVQNALDNAEARLFIDGKCIEHRKGMIDAGTLGPKGNVQVVIPMQSESYGSSVDPEPSAIPVCTLKNFPYEISHTIQWGKDLFEGLFNKRPMQANLQYGLLSNTAAKELGKKMMLKFGEEEAFRVSTEIREDLTCDFVGMTVPKDANLDEWEQQRNHVKGACLCWAAQLSEDLFEKSIRSLLNQHPADSMDEDEIPFWSGTRRLPKILSYDDDFDKAEYAEEDKLKLQQTANEYFIEFVRSAARLRMEMYMSTAGESSIISREEAIGALKRSMKPKLHSGEVDDDDPSSSNTSTLSKVVLNLEITSNSIKNLNIGDAIPLNAVEFEKDDDSNGHVEFVTAASNLRALIYSIAPTSLFETRRIAGNIIPAMITTTAFVSALSCIELLKLIAGAPRSLHRNAFVNLSLPFFAYTTPLPPEEIFGVGENTYTLWDRIEVQESKDDFEVNGGITLRKVLNTLKHHHSDSLSNVEVSSISYGPVMIYANFLHDEDDDLLDQSLWDLVIDAMLTGEDDVMENENTKDALESEADREDVLNKMGKKLYVDLSVIVEDVESGEDIEIPSVRVLKYRKES